MISQPIDTYFNNQLSYNMIKNISYTVDLPRNQPCWKINPKLWLIYNKLRKDNGLIQLSNSDYITEQDVVISIDLELLPEGIIEHGI